MTTQGWLTGPTETTIRPWNPKIPGVPPHPETRLVLLNIQSQAARVDFTRTARNSGNPDRCFCDGPSPDSSERPVRIGGLSEMFNVNGPPGITVRLDAPRTGKCPGANFPIFYYETLFRLPAAALAVPIEKYLTGNNTSTSTVGQGASRVFQDPDVGRTKRDGL